MNQAMIMKMKKLQKELEEKQRQLAETVFVGVTKGICEVHVKGTHEVVAIKIEKEAFASEDDIEMIEDAIVAASNDANKQIEEANQDLLSPYAGLMGGLF